ncbi:MAG: N-acetylglucosaminyl-diphospho-decaprenol L-rhamnosyltransferase [Mycobacteriales bacterium]|jgi:N-acetylglucosaminyl-diphospho-decaprenol L-rhamnosyltransferase
MTEPGTEDPNAGSPRAGELGVVTVTYSPGPVLGQFLDTLEKATTRPYQVLLADNGSTDGEPERAALRPEVTLLRTGGNLGYGRAANLAVPRLPGEWVLIANPDVTFEPGALDTLLAAVRRWPRAGTLGPAILAPDGSLYPSARALPSLGRGIGHAVFGWWWPSNPWTAAYRREREAPVEGPAGWLSGSCLLVRRAAFETVGGFDPAYFMYFEDLDLCERIGRAGWQNVYVPTAVVAHEGAHATSRAPAAMLTAHHRSAYRYLSRRYAGPRWLPVRLTLRAGLAARLALSRIVGRVGEGARPTRSASTLPR